MKTQGARDCVSYSFQIFLKKFLELIDFLTGLHSLILLLFIKKNTSGSVGLYHDQFIMTCKYLESREWGFIPGLVKEVLSCPSLVLYPLGVVCKGILSVQHSDCSHSDFLGDFRGIIPEVQNVFFPYWFWLV